MASPRHLLAALACVGLSSCLGPAPRPLVNESMDADSASAPSRIAFSYPQVFSRESLINDRIREGDYLDEMLAKSVDEQFVPQLRRDISTISSLAGQLGISFSPAAKIDFQRQQQLDDLRQEIEQTKLRADLQRVQTQLQQPQA